MTSGPALASPWFVRPPPRCARRPPVLLPLLRLRRLRVQRLARHGRRRRDLPGAVPRPREPPRPPHYASYENLADQLVEALTRCSTHRSRSSGTARAPCPPTRRAAPGRRRLAHPEAVRVRPTRPHEAACDRMLTLGEDELRAELATFLRGRGIEPRPDMLDMGMFVLLRDQAAAGAYRRTEPARIDCPITVLHWSQDTEVSLADLQGWRRYADSVEIRVVEGGHYDFMDAPAQLLTTLAAGR
ncbi:thioesterase [Streptomyces sp. M10(2022)]